MYHKSEAIHGDSLDVFANLFVLKTTSANSQVAMETVFFFFISTTECKYVSAGEIIMN